jgi:ATP-dependent Clp protease ATP-binding subunit ClpC
MKNKTKSNKKKSSKSSKSKAGAGPPKRTRKTATAKKTKTASSSRRGTPPVLEPDPEALLHLEERLHERIHGKDEVIDRIAQSIRVRLTHLDFRPERPRGSFLLVGPTGAGKNEIAYALAEILYGDETLVVPIDLTTLGNDEDVARLVDAVVQGPPPVLYEGLLTGSVRRRPQSILLLRGIEHAHPAAVRLVQQIIGQGWLDDARGRVFFDKTIILATSRIPEDDTGPTAEIGFTRATKTSSERIREKLTRRLGEEFMEEFQEVLVVPPLSPSDVRRIARYKVEVVLQRLQRVKRGVQVSETVYQTFIPDDAVRRDGAGMVNRTLEAKLLNPLARYLLAHPKEHDIRVDVKDGSLVIEPIGGQASVGSGASSVRAAAATTRSRQTGRSTKLPTA